MDSPLGSEYEVVPLPLHCGQERTECFVSVRRKRDRPFACTRLQSSRGRLSVKVVGLLYDMNLSAQESDVAHTQAGDFTRT